MNGKKIVFDSRYLGMSGIGRVSEEYILNLRDKPNVYFYGDPEKLDKLGIRTNVIKTTASPVTKRGMLAGREINHYDAFFTPNFIIPFGIKIPVYAMIHDLMFLDFPGSINNRKDKIIKRFFYKRCAKKATAVFTVSNFSKERAIHFFPVLKNKIRVVYNGVSSSALEYRKKHQNTNQKKNYLVFVGNAKKQKGLSVLLDAFKKQEKYKLYVVGELNNFRTRDEIVDKYLNDPGIVFTGKLNDSELFSVISEATFLVQPSLYEGFGIPPMEALCLGTTPIISDIEVFKEIYESLPVVFFESGNSDSLLEKINNTPADFSKSFDMDSISKFDYKTSIETIMGIVTDDQ